MPELVNSPRAQAVEDFVVWVFSLYVHFSPLVVLCLVSYLLYAGYCRWALWNLVPNDIEVVAQQLVRSMDDAVDAEPVDNEGNELNPEMEEAAREVGYRRIARNTRWKTRRISFVMRAAMAMKASLGMFPDDYESRLFGEKFCLRWMHEHGMRPSQIVGAYKAAVELWLTGTTAEVGGMQLRRSRAVEERKLMQHSRWRPGIKRWLSDSCSMSSLFSRASKSSVAESE